MDIALIKIMHVENAMDSILKTGNLVEAVLLIRITI
jgi:hypothetical protein